MTQPLRTRILSALALGYPLSSPDLQRMLCASENGVWTALRTLLRQGRIMRDGQQKRGDGHKARLWTLSWAERVPVAYVKTLTEERP